MKRFALKPGLLLIMCNSTMNFELFQVDYPIKFKIYYKRNLSVKLPVLIGDIRRS